MRRFAKLCIDRCGIAGIALLALWLCAGTARAADEPEIQVAVSADEIFVGDSFDYVVEIRNSKSPSAPDMSPVKQQFDVVSNKDESRNETSTVISGGRVSQHSVLRHIYGYRLTPKVAGKLVIPAVTATIDGKSLTSTEVPLDVVEAEKQDLVLVEIETSDAKVYPTQPYTVTARVLVHPLPKEKDQNPLGPLRRRPPHLQVTWLGGMKNDELSNWLRPLVAEDGIGFTLNDVGTNSFFENSRLVFDLSKGREIRNGLDGKPIRYFVYELSRTITPEKTGEYSYGPAIVKGTFVAGVDQREYTAKRLVAIAAATTVDVRDVPSPRPATFCGGIGEYKVTTSASPTALRVGDPLTLTVAIEQGRQSGSLELISAPDLSAIPQLTEGFDLIDKNPTGRIEGSVKKFSFSLRPKHSNVNIPSLTVSTFNPKTEEFVETATEAIPLEVSDAVRVTAGDLVGNMPSAGSSTIKTRAEGIYQNILDPSEVRDERIDLMAWTEAAAGVWGIAGCLIAIMTYYRHKTSDAGWMRRQQARKAANRLLARARSALAQGQPNEALGDVRAAIIGVVADIQNRIAEGLTTADVIAAMSAASVPAEEQSALETLLESIESAEYGGSKSADASTAIDTAAVLIARISPYLERGS